ncbi:UDP-glucose 4-epimerase GalE [Portibacter lacus]|uniref:UDP-glucose 4-epimerase n=1 Tax=Portibacter lacus TaxID=1099794 RepID=A0AA37SWQ9_9BACT|nr:UDP-glucose 4-epimerase GalE [Portibacter lacus]GLR19248.1 UDP-glucose 4-epimerase [Portibacter lacus]
MGKILVTGGCGYIGSHTVVDLIEHGYDIISVDNLINSKEGVIDNIKSITGVEIKNYEVDLCDDEALKTVFAENPDITGVIHFAALKAVGESVEQPVLYFRNNINGLISLVDCCVNSNVKHFIFSSSCTVYGNVEHLPCTEKSPIREAESPYGRTKQISEMIIEDSFRPTDVKAINLRYFNPAGAHISNKLGEDPKKVALNLVPVITETALGLRDKTVVFGDQYDTRDGSCIRDFIHVMDLADAHTKALQFLETSPKAKALDVFNLGIGQGVTVLEAIHAFEKVSGQKLNYEIGPPRPGDVIAIYADYSKAREELGWNPEKNIEDIMETSWKWANR